MYNCHRLQYLDVIINTGTEMLAMLDNLLDISKIEAGNMQLQLKQHHPVDIITRAINENRLSAIRKNINLHYSASAELKLIKITL